MDRLDRFRKTMQTGLGANPQRPGPAADSPLGWEAEYAEPSLLRRAGPMLPGLEQLLRAFDYANDIGCDVWDFALEIRDLRDAGLTRSDLRWLARKRYVEHGREVGLPGEERRSFHKVNGPSFTKRSCFILTAGGAIFVRGLCQRWVEGAVVHDDGPRRGQRGASRPVLPRWDRDLQELRVNGVIVKQFKVPAPNQEVVLAAFEEEGWPPRIDDPLPPHPEQDPKRRLHDTINSLNRNHKNVLIRFIGDGSGQGVRWTLVSDAADENGLADEEE